MATRGAQKSIAIAINCNHNRFLPAINWFLWSRWLQWLIVNVAIIAITELLCLLIINAVWLPKIFAADIKSHWEILQYSQVRVQWFAAKSSTVESRDAAVFVHKQKNVGWKTGFARVCYRRLATDDSWCSLCLIYHIFFPRIVFQKHLCWDIVFQKLMIMNTYMYDSWISEHCNAWKGTEYYAELDEAFCYLSVTPSIRSQVRVFFTGKSWKISFSGC